MSGVYAPYHYTPSSGADAGSNNAGGSYAIAPEDDPMWERVYVSYNDFIAPDGKPVEFPITLRNYKKDDVYFAGYYYDQYGLKRQDLVDLLVTEWVHPSFLGSADPDTDGDGSPCRPSPSSLKRWLDKPVTGWLVEKIRGKSRQTLIC